MKHISSFLLGTFGPILFCSGLHAQQSSGTSLDNEYRRTVSAPPKMKPSIHQAYGSMAKTVGAGSRLTAEVRGNFNASQHWLPDSTVYSYSGGHGGDYEHLVTPYPLKYDSAISWTTDPATYTYKLSRKRMQTFDLGNDMLAVQTELQWLGSTWVNSARTIVHYKGTQSDTIISQHYDAGTGSWVNYDRITTGFNGGGYVVGTSYDTWSTATNTYTTQAAYQYLLDANNNRATELEFNYDAPTMTLKPGFRVFHHYNSANIEVSYAFQQASGASWVNTDSASYVLNGSNLPTEYLYYSWNAASSTWIKTSHLLVGYNATGKILYEAQQNWNNTTGVYTNYDSTRNTYNAADQVQLYHFYSFTAGINEAEAHYYYEQYTPSGIVAGNAYAALHDLCIYPVPADYMLHVSLSMSKSQPVSCMLYDATGRIVRSWQDAGATIYNSNLSLNGVPAGNYWLRIATGDAVVVKTLIVEHSH